MDINLSAVLEQALAQLLKQRHLEQWLKENCAAIAAYNQEVEAEVGQLTEQRDTLIRALGFLITDI